MKPAHPKGVRRKPSRAGKRAIYGFVARGGRKRESLLLPLLAAFLVVLLMAVVCFVGIHHVVRQRQAAQEQQASPRVPHVLPRIADASGSPGMLRPASSLTEPEERAVAGALEDLQALAPRPAPLPPPSTPSPAAARMVIVMDDLGESMAQVHALLALTYPVTCAFWPHGAHAREGAMAVRRAGGEILVHYPMEPVGNPGASPGPRALTQSMSAEHIARLVRDGISRVPYAVGLNNHMGSRFTQNRAAVTGVILTLKEHGLFLLDSVTHPRSVLADQGRRLGVTTFARDVFLDHIPTRAAIFAELKRAEAIALQTGRSIAIGHPLPETLAVLKQWQHSRNTAVRIVRLRDL